MVISTNNIPSIEDFKQLIDRTLVSLKSDSMKRAKFYLTLGGQKLEKTVTEVLTYNARDTVFENSIELVSGQKFPDIVAKKYYGIEVKTTKSNHWKSTGSSIAEGTRVESVERIFMLFGKIVRPIEFKCKPYEECLSEVVVTHSPRYLIDMNIEKGKTIFEKMRIPYDELRKQPNPIQTVLKYYRRHLKPGEETWWLEQDSQPSTSLIIRIWNNLSTEEKSMYRAKGFSFFPELLNNSNDKFNRFAIWLSAQEGIVCHNVRDIYTSGGQGTYIFRNKKYSLIPKIILKIIKDASVIHKIVTETDSKLLSEFWRTKVNESNKFNVWINLASKNAGFILSSTFPFKEVLEYEFDKF